MTHLDALYDRLQREITRMSEAGSQKERAMRAVWVAQIEKEIAGERRFLTKQEDQLPDMTDDELLAALRE